MVTLHLIPNDVAQTYQVYEWRNAAGVLSTAHPTEWQDVIDVLRAFEFRRGEVLKGGGRKSVIANASIAFLKREAGRKRSSRPKYVLIRRKETLRLTKWTASRRALDWKSNGTTRTRSLIAT